MVNILFYKYSGDKSTINKKLTNPLNLAGSFNYEINLISPTLLIRGNDIETYNYCYISELNRYYFIKSKTIINDGDTRIDLYLDVLKTYENVILEAQGTIIESSNANKYISTRENIYDSRPNFEVINYEPKLFKDFNNIILVALKGSEL